MERRNTLKLVLLFLLGAIVGVLFSNQIVSTLRDLFYPGGNLPTAILPKENGKKEKSCQIQKQKSIEVDLTEQKLALCDQGKVIEEFPISTGKKETPTISGQFNVIRKTAMLYSQMADCWLPFWVGFSEDYGFHELPICEPDQKRIGENEIGQPASIGCVRLKIGDAEVLYDFAQIGMPVIIYGETP